jgi:hypothetical protein
VKASSQHWYDGMILPTLLLWACACVSAVLPVIPAYHAEGTSPPTGLLRVAFAVAISIWVTADARKRRRALPYDYDGFLFFAWPILGRCICGRRGVGARDSRCCGFCCS